MEMGRVNAAVKIRLALERLRVKQDKLTADLHRLLTGMEADLYNEYIKRIRK